METGRPGALYPYLTLIFELLFLFGFLGVLAMVLTGAGHHGSGAHFHGLHFGGHGGVFGHGGHAGALGHGGHAGGATHALPGAHGASGGHSGSHGGNGKIAPGNQPGRMLADTETGFSILSFLPSPLDVFSVCLGTGAAGLLLQKLIAGSSIYTVAIIAGVVFDILIVRQIISFALRFASKPSEGLEGLVAQPAEAITRFDRNGVGMVRLVMDGQIVQLLAKLDPSELATGVRVLKGDQVVLLEVDAKKNTCCVTRELSD